MKKENKYPFSIWCYDFEVFSKVPCGGWWCVNFRDYFERDKVITIINNRNEFLQFYNEHKNDVFISYNGRQYDTGIWKALLSGMNVGYANDKFIKEGKKVFQVVKNAKEYQLFDYDAIIKDRSLKVLEAFMGDDIRETDVPFDIDRPLTDEEIGLIIKYNLHDTAELAKVLEQTWDDFEGQLDIIELYGVDFSNISKTKVQLAVSPQILNAVSQHTMDDEFDIRLPDTIQIPEKYQFICKWYLNPKNWRYKEHLHSNDDQHNNQLKCIVAGIPHVFGYGGCHGADEKETIFEGIILHCDVSSMYPTTDIEYNVLSRKFKNPNDFREMRDFRLKMKAEKNPKNKSLKPMINGTYGASKDRNNPSYDPLMANLTCIFGQMFILDLVAHLEPYCQLLQTNTDGVFVLCKDEAAKQKVIEITNAVGKRLRMEFEIDEFSKLIQKDVNNYIAVSADGNLECKGKMVKFNTPIDNDCAILNDAVRNYFAYGTSVEETINNCHEMIKFQKIVKLSAKYKEVWYGVPTLIEGEKEKVASISGTKLKEKVHRVFASTREDGGIYKAKMEKGNKSYEKFADTPTKLFIDNSDIHEKPLPEYLDKQYYIDEAKKRIDMFLDKTPEKVDDVPNILFDCMCTSDNFYDFLVKASEKGITNKILNRYITADCCSVYGKTKKLLDFKKQFDLLYGKSKINVSALEKKFPEEWIRNIIISHSELSKSGKTYAINDKEILLNIFKEIPDEHTNEYDIMAMQVDLFNEVRYRNEDYKDVYFVLNTRDMIAPNLILYDMKTGEYLYRKVQKDIYKILPIQDGDIITVTGWKKDFAQKIIGKDENGINILAADINKELDIVSAYDITYRNYEKSESLISEEY